MIQITLGNANCKTRNMSYVTPAPATLPIFHARHVDSLYFPTGSPVQSERTGRHAVSNIASPARF